MSDVKVENFNGYENDVVKEEYVIKGSTRTLSLGCVSESDKRKLADPSEEEPEVKKRKPNHAKLKGQNKCRPKTYTEEKGVQLCPNLVEGAGQCSHEKCVFVHDTQAFLASKPPDIGATCYVYSVRGHCPRGITCRFGKCHTSSDGKTIVNTDLQESWERDEGRRTLNSLEKALQVSLWKKNYDFGRSQAAIDAVDRERGGKGGSGKKDKESNAEGITVMEGEVGGDKERRRKRKQVDWAGKLYLAPLTTVGNLPFRRVCVEWGAEVTCGEMAMAKNLLQGQKAEWALVKRHASEKLFGVQICGNNQYIMTKCAQLLQEQTEIDFIDVNLGCPLDFIHDQGAGSGLLRRERVLSNVLRCMDRVCDVPLTLKTRTGLVLGKNIAREMMAGFRDAGVDLITVHGRTRDQRYSKSADWAYIEECAKAAAPTPLFGNGDVLSYEDYEQFMSQAPSAAGAMIGRGALIKPWIFKEMKEKKHYDITSAERLEMLKRYVNYGLEHWGSDTRGVETTRRFLLEWLSFLYRYIPVGLLKAPPQRMNTRPPSSYFGRDDLETLMASPAAEDWIKISEMLLGPVPEGFTFLPKHKARAWKN